VTEKRGGFMEKYTEIRAVPKVELLFEENIETFNRLVEEGKAPDLRNANLSGMDLRTAHFKGLDLSGCYLRNTNMRGLDLTGCNLMGASLQGAQISGVLFPDNVSMKEIEASVEYGTRIRTSDANQTLKKILFLLTEIYRILQQKAAER
jgi:uncharacterized protein YjbI with pentapeptide repeats